MHAMARVKLKRMVEIRKRRISFSSLGKLVMDFLLYYGDEFDSSELESHVWAHQVHL